MLHGEKLLRSCSPTHMTRIPVPFVVSSARSHSNHDAPRPGRVFACSSVFCETKGGPPESASWYGQGPLVPARQGWSFHSSMEVTPDVERFDQPRSYRSTSSFFHRHARQLAAPMPWLARHSSNSVEPSPRSLQPRRGTMLIFKQHVRLEEVTEPLHFGFNPFLDQGCG